MKPNEIDQILSTQEEILPSSGFSDVVMDAIRREAATPAPIPFPWLRAVPGMIAATILVIQAFLIRPAKIHIDLLAHAADEGWWTFPHWSVSPEVVSVVAWLAILLVVTYTIIRLSMRLTAN